MKLFCKVPLGCQYECNLLIFPENILIVLSPVQFDFIQPFYTLLDILKIKGQDLQFPNVKVL